ncbi:MAG TPA: Ig-like domain-containing protein [Mycobacteriales bacterium]|nr:Ig-like domain-containing protein [Mycobacteriales bacterium]
MHRARRAARIRAVARLLVAAVAATVTVAVAPTPAAAAPPESLTGTYELLATDTVDGHGDLEHHYTEVLRVPGKKAYPVKMPAGHRVRAGSRIQVSAYRTSGGTLDVRSIRRISASNVAPSLGTHSVLVILAYWTRPDSVTPAIARARFFDDANKWFRESSYGQYGISGTVTPWVKIPAPANNQCYAGAETMFYDARAAAEALGAAYDSDRYTRTVLYFPRCTGTDTKNVAGWAYEPGPVAWLNGYLDRRTVVHEQGHNLGLGHARAHTCRTLSGTPVTYSAKCSVSEYGDQFDAMGRSGYTAHYTGYRKHLAGWLGGSRKRVLPSSAPTTFTLPPLERSSTSPLVVIARSPKVFTRSYWLEFRRPIGMDRYLPSGATGGVLIHVVDTAQPTARGSLLDGTPKDGTMSTAVLKSGTSWTAPDGVKIAAGAIGTSGIRVTVTGARPNPTIPSAPRYVTASTRDQQLDVSWQAPAFDGYSPITHYVVRADGADVPVEVMEGAGSRSTVVSGLANDVRYAVTVAAVNAIGERRSVAVYGTPRYLPPSVRITSPASGATVRGIVPIFAEVTPNPITQLAVECVSFYLDEEWVGGGCTIDGGHSTAIDTSRYPNGEHLIRVLAHDENHRVAEAERLVRFQNPLPEVRFTSVVDGAALPDVEKVTLEVAATVPLDPSVGITDVQYFDVTDGEYFLGRVSTAPYRLDVDVARTWGRRVYRAVATGTNGLSGRKDVTVHIGHPESTLTITSPVAGSPVGGSTTLVTADAVVHAVGSAPAKVEFYVDDRYLGSDSTAPFEVPWNIADVTGTHRIRAALQETSGRSAWSPEVTVVIDNSLPVLTVTSPGPSGSSVPNGTIRVAGTATAGPGGEAPDRVVVYGDGSLLGTVAPAADGSWSLDWATTATGHRALRVFAYTPGGLYQEHYAYYYLHRPRPTIAMVSPADGSSVPLARATDVTIEAAPAPGDTRTVSTVCVEFSSGERPCTSKRGPDGHYHLTWTPQATGTRYLRPQVVMSDHTYYYGSSAAVTVTTV